MDLNAIILFYAYSDRLDRHFRLVAFTSFDVVRSGAQRVSILALALPVALLLSATLPNAAFVDPSRNNSHRPSCKLLFILAAIAYLAIHG